MKQRAQRFLAVRLAALRQWLQQFAPPAEPALQPVRVTARRRTDTPAR